MTSPVDHPTIYAALAAAQHDCGKLVKNAVNPHFKNRYADLTAVLDVIRDPVEKNGLVLYQATTVQDLRTCLVTTISMTDGSGAIESVAYLPAIDDPQKIGSAISYYRRYQLVSLFNLTAEDDDGEGANNRPQRTEPERVVARNDAPKEKPAFHLWQARIRAANLDTNAASRKQEWANMIDDAMMWKDGDYVGALLDMAADEKARAYIRDKAAQNGVTL